MRLLFVNQTFYPDLSATAQQLTDLCAELASRGHQVTVLADRRDYLNPARSHPREETHAGVKIVRVRSFDLGGASRWRRIFSAMLLNAAMAIKLFSMPRPDVAVSLTSPPLIAGVAALWAKLGAIPFVYWVMDLNPDQAIAAGWIRADSYRAKFLRWVLRRTLKSSSRVIVLDRYMAERVISYGVDPARVSILPPWPVQEDSVEAVPRDQNSFLREHELTNSFVAMYSGNHSICHPLATVLEAAKELESDPEIQFVFVGGGERVREVAQFKERHQLKNILQLPYQPREKLSHSLSAADVHFVVLGEPYVGIVHPCKVYGVIQVQRPTIYLGPAASHLGEMVKESQIGEQVEHGDVAGMVAAVRRARDRTAEERSAMERHLAELAQGRYSRPLLIKAIVECLERLDGN